MTGDPICSVCSAKITLHVDPALSCALATGSRVETMAQALDALDGYKPEPREVNADLEAFEAHKRRVCGG